MLKDLIGKRVLVTGAEGFIGRRVAALASAADARVVGIDVKDADLMDGNKVVEVFAAQRPEIVIHTAGLVDWTQDAALFPPMLGVHVRGTAHVLEGARHVGAARVVCFGSAGEYGAAATLGPVGEETRAEPLDPYSVSKLCATELALTYGRSFGVATTVVRPFNVYGTGEPARRLFPSLFALAKKGGGEFPCSEGAQERDFVHVDDVAEGALRAAITPRAAGAILNLCTGVSTTVRDAITLAAKISGGTIMPRFGATPYRKGEPMRLVGATARCHALLNWSPSIPLADGLERMWRS